RPPHAERPRRPGAASSRVARAGRAEPRGLGATDAAPLPRPLVARCGGDVHVPRSTGAFSLVIPGERGCASIRAREGDPGVERGCTVKSLCAVFEIEPVLRPGSPSPRVAAATHGRG